MEKIIQININVCGNNNQFENIGNQVQQLLIFNTNMELMNFIDRAKRLIQSSNIELPEKSFLLGGLEKLRNNNYLKS
ncbi:MAG: hypothetical protein IPM71_01595 [Bacteroidota bacterium]|nr:MAG: hypothetical protein IPM71_01595 [Bacteroidota bacterium]